MKKYVFPDTPLPQKGKYQEETDWHYRDWGTVCGVRMVSEVITGGGECACAWQSDSEPGGLHLARIFFGTILWMGLASKWGRD